MDKRNFNEGSPFKDVTFTEQQMRYLEHLFPTQHFGPDATENALRHYHGQQQVLHSIRNRTRGNFRTPSNTHDLPIQK